MSNSEKLGHCRLIDYEIDYIDNFWNGKFSDFVHSKIKEDIKNHKDKNILFKELSTYIVLMGLGVFFFFFGLRSIYIFEMVLSYVLGLFMLIFGVVGGLLYALQSTRSDRKRR